MATRVTIWSVCPRNAHTNEVISEFLQGLNSSELFSQRDCADGEKRNLIDMPDYRTLDNLLKSRSAANLRFDVYRRQGNSLPAKYEFPKPSVLGKGGVKKHITTADKI